MARIPKGQLVGAMIEYLRQHGGEGATVEVHKAMEAKLGRKIGTSSVRGGLQNERYFERVRDGHFRLRKGVLRRSRDLN